MSAHTAQTELKLIGKLILEGDLHCETGLHIGAGKGSLEIGGADNPVVKDSSGSPYVPGSSLRGRLRSLAGTFPRPGDPRRAGLSFAEERAGGSHPSERPARRRGLPAVRPQPRPHGEGARRRAGSELRHAGPAHGLRRPARPGQHHAADAREPRRRADRSEERERHRPHHFASQSREPWSGCRRARGSTCASWWMSSAKRTRRCRRCWWRVCACWRTTASGAADRAAAAECVSPNCGWRGAGAASMPRARRRRSSRRRRSGGSAVVDERLGVSGEARRIIMQPAFVGSLFSVGTLADRAGFRRARSASRACCTATLSTRPSPLPWPGWACWRSGWPATFADYGRTGGAVQLLLSVPAGTPLRAAALEPVAARALAEDPLEGRAVCARVRGRGLARRPGAE